jgi:hypothetical protein
MGDWKLPYVLVAERSVLPVIGLALHGIQAHGNPESISIATPSSQVDEFRVASEFGARVIAEDEVLAEWSLARVRSVMPKHFSRGGHFKMIEAENERTAAGSLRSSTSP